MPRKRTGKEPQDGVELTDVGSDSDVDQQPVRLPRGLPLDDPPPCLPVSSHLEVEQVCQRHLSDGYIPMSVFPWLTQQLPFAHPHSHVAARQPWSSLPAPTNTPGQLGFGATPGSTPGPRLFLPIWFEHARTPTSPPFRCCTT